MCENRGQFGSTDKPRVVPWAQSVIPKWTGFSRIAAAVLLPRRLLTHVHAAIHVQRRARDVAGLTGCKEGDGCRDIFRHAEPAHWNLLQ
jgi:hypothetical protein